MNNINNIFQHLYTLLEEIRQLHSKHLIAYQGYDPDRERGYKHIGSKGEYLTICLNYALLYGPVVRKYSVTLNHPLILNIPEDTDWYDSIYWIEPDYPIDWNSLNAEDISKLQEIGYDGILINWNLNTKRNYDNPIIIIVFDKSQLNLIETRKYERTIKKEEYKNCEEPKIPYTVIK